MTEQNPTTEPVELTDTEAAEVLESMAQDGHTTTTEGTESPETPPDDPEAPEPAQGEDKRPKAAREAARYRTQLREAEAQRDELTGRVEALQRQVIDSHVEKHGLNPALLWDTGLNAADMLTEDGTVDDGKVQDATRAAVQKYGLNTRRPDPAQMAEAGEDDRPPRLFEAHKS